MIWQELGEGGHSQRSLHRRTGPTSAHWVVGVCVFLMRDRLVPFPLAGNTLPRYLPKRGCSATQRDPMNDLRFRSYVICTSPRSGSTLLCKLLAATEVAGHPGSHFHKPSLAAWLKSYDLERAHFASDRAAVRAVVAAARAKGMGNTEVFGLRLQRGSFAFFRQQMAGLHPDQKTDVARIQAVFGPTLFVHLTRRNKLDQAISCVKATQTGLWHKAADGTELERLAAPQAPVYDAQAISEELASFTAMDAAWDDWFAQEGVDPLRIDYDDLALAPTKALGRVLDALGLDRSIASTIAPPTAKLSDAVSSDWARRFRQDRAGA